MSKLYRSQNKRTYLFYSFFLGLFFTLFLVISGCVSSGNEDGLGPLSLKGQTGKISLGKVSFAIRQVNKSGVKGSVLAQVGGAQAGIKRVEAEALHLLSGQVIRAAAPFIPGGILKISEVPVGQVRVSLKAFGDLSPTPLFSGSLEVNVVPDIISQVDSVTLFEGGGNSIPGGGLIQNVTVLESNETGGTLSFLTTVPAKSFLEFSKEGEPVSTNRVDVSTTFVTNHIVTLSGLDSNARYIARITAEDEKGQVFRGEIFSLNQLADNPLNGDFAIALAGGGSTVSSPEVPLILKARDATGMVIFFIPLGVQSPPPQPPSPIPFRTEFLLNLPNQPGPYRIEARFFKEGKEVGQASLEILFDNRLFSFNRVQVGFVTTNFAEILWETNKQTKTAFVQFRILPDGAVQTAQGLGGPEGPLGPPPPVKIQGNLKSTASSENADSWQKWMRGLKQKGGKSPLASILPQVGPPPPPPPGPLTAFPNAAILQNLQADKTYEARVFVEDLDGKKLESEVLTFVTVEVPFNIFPNAAFTIGLVATDTFGQVRVPKGVAVRPSDNHIFVSDFELGQITEFSETGIPITQFGSGTIPLTNPFRLEFGNYNGQGALYVADGNAIKILQAGPPYNSISTISPVGTTYCADLTYSPAENRLYAIGKTGDMNPNSPGALEVYSVSGVASELMNLQYPGFALGGEPVFSLQITSAAANPASFVAGPLDAGGQKPTEFLATEGFGITRGAGGTVPSGYYFDLALNKQVSPPDVYFVDSGNFSIGKFSVSDLNTGINSVLRTAIPGFPHDSVNLLFGAVAVSPQGGGTVITTDKSDTTLSSGTVFLLSPGTFNYQKTIGFYPGQHPQQGLFPYGKPFYNGSQDRIYVPEDSATGRIRVFDGGLNVVKVLDVGVAEQVIAITGSDLNNDIFCTTSGSRLFRFAPGSTSPDDSLAGVSAFCDLAWGLDDNLYLLNTSGTPHLEKRVATPGGSFGNLLGSFGNTGPNPGEFGFPEGIHVINDVVSGNGTNNFIAVADTYHDRIQIFDTNFNLVKIFGSPGQPPLFGPHDITGVGPVIFISDSGNFRILMVDLEDSEVVGAFGTPGPGLGQFLFPVGLSSDIGPGGVPTLIVGDSVQEKIQVFRY